MSTRGMELLTFLAPGLVHRLHRTLSAIEEQALFLEGAARTEILTATRKAQGAVRVLRHLSQDAGAVQAGLLLPRLVDVLAVPMAERGLALSWEHSSREPPARVHGRLLCETVAGALEALAQGLPAGFRGGVLVDLCAQGAEKVEVLLELVPDRDQLPFRVELLPVQQEMQRVLSPRGGLAVLMGRKLSLHLPAVPG